MQIIVCIKQVPGTTEVKINPETNTLMRESVAGIINPYDTYALEEGVRIKERSGGEVTVLSMGPPQVQESLREAISLGADKAVLLSDRAFAGADTWATAYTLSAGIKKLGTADLIICGKQAIDGDTAQVGPGMTEFLDIPFVAFVRKVEGIGNGKIKVERLMDDGYEVVEMSLPALITVVKEINEPRLPSLKGKMRAKSAPITVYNADDLGVDKQKCGLNGSPTKVDKIFTPPPRGGGQQLSGSASEVADKLAGLLRAAQVI
ncbi:MAG: electron transfer flavoprotein subunit beta/FixA family protein [Candidatus Schekmanbacteria bacterium]|nr:electron transfer flavoprotein subunit beta/FixA family protein [Candidatus Schekmanbacteria bacterium]